MQRAPPVKRVRKAKRSVTKIVPPVHAQHDSDDSEGESVTSGSFLSYFRSCLVVKNPLFLNLAGCNNEQISDYNAAFTLQNEFNGVEEQNLVENETTVEQAFEGTIVQYVDELPEGLAEGDRETLYELTPINHNEQPDGSCLPFVNQVELENHPLSNECKCMGKMRNKMDYFQKRVLSEISDFRRETMSSIRNLADIVSRSLNIVLDEEADEAGEISDELSEKYEGMFPVNDKDTLHAVNKRIKSETDLKLFLQLKLDKISNIDATKTARKMLNALCTVNCISQFTWLGTKKKDKFSDLESLIDIIAKIMEQRFPKCGAFNIIETVVKQRAKSAGEATKESGRVQNNDQQEPTTTAPPVSSDFQFSDPFVAGPFDPEGFLNLYE